MANRRNKTKDEMNVTAASANTKRPGPGCSLLLAAPGKDGHLSCPKCLRVQGQESGDTHATRHCYSYCYGTHARAHSHNTTKNPSVLEAATTSRPASSLCFYSSYVRESQKRQTILVRLRSVQIECHATDRPVSTLDIKIKKRG